MCWKRFGERCRARIENVKFENGEKRLRLQAASGSVVVRQTGIYLQQGFDYNGSVWLKPETGALQIKLLPKDSGGNLLATSPLRTSGTSWPEIAFSSSNPRTDANSAIQIVANLTPPLNVNNCSLMRQELRVN